MTIRKAVGFGFVFGVFAFVGSACTLWSPTIVDPEVGDPTDPTDENEIRSKKSDASTSTTPPTTGPTCTGKFAKVDPAKLTACAEGKGHCYPKAKTPEGGAMFTACPTAGEVCVPDEILEAGGSPLKSCTSIIGPGGCVNLFSLNVPPAEKEQAKAALKQDVCSSGQVCSPCADPRKGGAPTPFCVPIGVFSETCTAGGTSPTTAAPAPAAPAEKCCTTNGKSNGICIPETAVPEADRDDAPKDTCSGTNRCAPAAFVEGKPVTCDGGFMGRGVCMDKCFNSMMSMGSSLGFLSSKGCGTTEICIPCLFVQGKGVPGCG
jgi:hypothetical protein